MRKLIYAGQFCSGMVSTAAVPNQAPA